MGLVRRLLGRVQFIVRLRAFGKVYRFSVASKTELRSLARQHREWLRPGLWFLTPGRPIQRPLARHVRSRPQSLCSRVKMLSPPEPPSALHLSRRLAFELRRLGELSAPPWVMWVRRGGRPDTGSTTTDGRHTYTMVTPARTGGALLLRPGEVVLRPLPNDGGGSHLQARGLVSDFLPVPGFRVVAGGSFVEERFIDGPLLMDLPSQSWSGVVQQLLACYGRRHPDLDARHSECVVMAALDRLDRLDHAPSSWTDEVRVVRSSLLESSRRWPLLPSHGDLMPGNVVVHPSGPVAIDLEYAGWLPFFFDPFRLMIEGVAMCEPRSWRAMLESLHSDASRALFKLHGLELTDEELRRCLIAYVALTADLYGGDDTQTRAMLAFQWDRIRRLL